MFLCLGRSAHATLGNAIQSISQFVPLKRWLSSTSSPFRIGEHVGNLENKSTPFVLIETSFLTKCTLMDYSSSIVSKQSSSVKALRTIEGFVRKSGGIPLSLGMVNGEVFAVIIAHNLNRLSLD